MVISAPRPLKKPHTLKGQLLPHLLQQPQRPLESALLLEVGPKLKRALNRPQPEEPPAPP